jgi:uncharacterized phiE125 gp8 family phage protein
MAAYDLTGLDNVKAYLGLATSNDDVLLARLITAISGYAQQWMGRAILSSTYNEVRNGSGSRLMAFANYPVTAVSSLKVDTNVIQPAADVVSPGYRFDGRLLYVNGGCFNKGIANVEVSYTAGYATVPAELEQAVIELVAMRYRERDRIGHQSKSLGGETVSFIVKDFPDSVRTILTNYKKVVPQ